MEDHRNCQLSRFIEVIVDTDTVVADGAVDVEPDRGQVRQQSAEAVSDESDTPDVIGQTTKAVTVSPMSVMDRSSSSSSRSSSPRVNPAWS